MWQWKENNIGVAQKLDYRTFKLDIPKLSVNADIQNNNLTLKSDINVQNQGRIGTDLKIHDLSKGRQLRRYLYQLEGLRLSLANQLFSSGWKHRWWSGLSLKFRW